MQDSLPHSEVAHSNSKSKSKVGTKQLCNMIAYCLHPDAIEVPEVPGVSKFLPIRVMEFRIDLRVVRNEKGTLSWVQLLDDNVLKIISRDEVRGHIACAYGKTDEAVKNLVSKDYDVIIKVAEDKATDMDAIAERMGLPNRFVIASTEVKDVLFKSDIGYCYKRLDFDPDENADPSIWETETLRQFTKNKIGLMTWIGGLFFDNSPKEKYVWLYGDGRDGKSVLANFLMNIFGNAAFPTNNEAIKDKWFNADLVGKRLCYLPEGDSNLVATGKFKALTGERKFRIENKYEKPTQEIVNTRFLISSNELPIMPRGRSHARRIILVGCNEIKFDTFRSDKEIEELLMKGASWFIGQCIKAYKADPEMIKHDNELLEMLQGDDFKAELFKNRFVKDPDGFVEASKIDSILDKMDKSKREKDEFKSWLIIALNCRYERRYIRGVQCRGLKGVRLK